MRCHSCGVANPPTFHPQSTPNPPRKCRYNVKRGAGTRRYFRYIEIARLTPIKCTSRSARKRFEALIYDDLHGGPSAANLSSHRPNLFNIMQIIIMNHSSEYEVNTHATRFVSSIQHIAIDASHSQSERMEHDGTSLKTNVRF